MLEHVQRKGFIEMQRPTYDSNKINHEIKKANVARQPPSKKILALVNDPFPY